MHPIDAPLSSNMARSPGVRTGRSAIRKIFSGLLMSISTNPMLDRFFSSLVLK